MVLIFAEPKNLRFLSYRKTMKMVRHWTTNFVFSRILCDQGKSSSDRTKSAQRDNFADWTG
jgi:hypothetical protein